MSIRNWLTQTVAVLSVVSLYSQVEAQNDIVAEWTFETSVPETAGPHAPETGSGSAIGFHSNVAAVYSNPVGNGSAESFSSNNWLVNDYYQFQTSTLGLSDIGLIFDHTGSNTGPRDFQFQYSTNGSTFTDFGSPYMLTNDGWSSGGATTASTQVFDLTSIAALDNQADVYFRLLNNSTTAISSPNPVAPTGSSRVDNVTIYSDFVPPDEPPPPPDPRLPQPGDVVFGLSVGSAANTLELVSGPAAMDGGSFAPGPWSSDSFIQSVAFDNYDGQSHNARGNLLGVNFSVGGGGNSGAIYSFATQGSIPAPAAQLIGNTGATDPAGQDGSLTQSALAGLSVSPANSKVAVVGVDTGRVIVYDYTPGDTMGSGAALADGRESAAVLDTGSTQGTAWLDDDTVLAFSAGGNLFEVDADTMATSNEATVETTIVGIGTFAGTPSVGSDFASLAYNPDVSQYLYALYSGFSGELGSITHLYVLDPSDSYNQLADIELSASSETGREIALDADGNLFIGGFGGTIDFLPASAVLNPASLTNNSSVDWYTSSTFSVFNGLDIGFGEAGLPGDHNQDGTVDAADYALWRSDPGAYDGAQGYTDWVNNFGATSGPGAGSGPEAGAVPEPTSLAMLLVGFIGLWSARRRA